MLQPVKRWAWDALLQPPIAYLVRRAGGFMHRPGQAFYSPLGDVEDLRSQRDRLWPATPAPTLGIDWNDAQQQQLLHLLPRLAADFDYPIGSATADEALDHFYDGNSQFTGTDARVLFAMLRWHQPGRIIEVGSGYSTLLMSDVNQRFLAGASSITCIEPYPRPFLHRMAADEKIALVQSKVQDVPLAAFEGLQQGDLLFIDSSHVAKTGSDVNFLLFEVLPRLRAGVLIHVHDIPLPFEYPPLWVLDENRSWNEQYILRALLMFAGTALRVVFSSSYAYATFGKLPDELTCDGSPYGTSLWLERGS